MCPKTRYLNPYPPFAKEIPIIEPIITLDIGIGTKGKVGKWQNANIFRIVSIENKIMLKAVPNITTNPSVGERGNNFRPTVSITFLSAIKHPKAMAPQTAPVILAGENSGKADRKGPVKDPMLFAPKV